MRPSFPELILSKSCHPDVDTAGPIRPSRRTPRGSPESSNSRVDRHHFHDGRPTVMVHGAGAIAQDDPSSSALREERLNTVPNPFLISIPSIRTVVEQTDGPGRLGDDHPMNLPAKAGM